MASTSTTAAATKSILKPVTTLKCHRMEIRSISYFPDGQQMISGSYDKTSRQWDLKACKEIEDTRGVCENAVYAVAVSRDGRWVVSAGGDYYGGELKACEVETGIVKTFEGHSNWIMCIDISTDSTLLASGSYDKTVRIWNLETRKLVAGPFASFPFVGAVRFSTDSKKLALKSDKGKCLEIWDVQAQKLDVRIGEYGELSMVFMFAPIFWTNRNKNILAAFSFREDEYPKTIYEFDALTLEAVGTPFEGHTEFVTGLALSFDCTLLASSSDDNSIKLWACKSRQLLATFDVQSPVTLVLSPDSRQLAYTTNNYPQVNHKIYICNTPPDILAQARTSARNKSMLSVQVVLEKPIFLRLRKLISFFSHTNAVPAVRDNQTRGPLDLPATSPLPSNIALSVQPTAQINNLEIRMPPPHSLPPSKGVAQFPGRHTPFQMPRYTHELPIVEVAAGRRVTLAAANLAEYKRLYDVYPPQSQQSAMPQDIESSDID